jgi:hypothetical protein
MMPSWPRYILNVLTLTEPNAAETKAFKEALKFLAPGMQGTFDQLEAYLAKAQARA